LGSGQVQRGAATAFPPRHCAHGRIVKSRPSCNGYQVLGGTSDFFSWLDARRLWLPLHSGCCGRGRPRSHAGRFVSIRVHPGLVVRCLHFNENVFAGVQRKSGWKSTENLVGNSIEKHLSPIGCEGGERQGNAVGKVRAVIELVATPGV
jgi:hypothetical protein